MRKAAREFEIVREFRPEGIVRLQKISCGQCGANDEHRVSHDKPMPFDAVAHVFRRRGWLIGSSPRHDLCPGCVLARHPRKSREPETPMQKEPTSAPPSPSEQPPRVMGREDRQIIFARLSDVYLGERVGYGTGWNDERVARDLNCPRKWVEDVREEFFGPIRADQSPEIIEITGRLAAVEESASQAMAVITGIEAAASGTARLLEENKGALAGLQKELASIRASVAKITGRPT